MRSLHLISKDSKNQILVFIRIAYFSTWIVTLALVLKYLLNLIKDHHKENRSNIPCSVGRIIHQNDVIMNAMASQITGVSTAFLNRLFRRRLKLLPVSLAFMRGIRR